MRQQSSSPKEQVTTRPRDLRIGPDRPLLLWHKWKWRCRVPECERKVFTEALPEQIPSRARITTRARRAAAVPIGDRESRAGGPHRADVVGHGHGAHSMSGGGLAEDAGGLPGESVIVQDQSHPV